MPLYQSILETIGATPLVHLSRITAGLPFILLGKVEMMNPGGSVKDRIALAIIRDAEESGRLKPGATLIEATAGNTGVGLAMIAAIKGYQCVFVMPKKMSQDKEDLLCAYGARVIRTADAPPGDPHNFQEVAKRLAVENDWFLTDQFANPANPDIHYHTTGKEIWTDTEGNIDTLVCGVGTGGSLTGVGKYLKERKASVEVVLADPVGSTFSGGESASYLVEGIGGSAIPLNFDSSLVDVAIAVPDVESFQTARRMAKEEGLLVGGAAGCAVAAAIRYGSRPENNGKTIVAILPDTGRNYLSKIFNDEWMREKGLL